MSNMGKHEMNKKFISDLELMGSFHEKQKKRKLRKSNKVII